ncbi:hypothetical protein, partial [Mesorhizobium sp. M7A.F.Ca.CA.004.06.2.1]|uniref:hypothetical protein n=1 Tax=Mesorhizobium sp. M7A.F.Ca.CA.004.06.2.1 TaxID=2496687 RepID=UPI0019D16785
FNAEGICVSNYRSDVPDIIRIFDNGYQVLAAKRFDRSRTLANRYSGFLSLKGFHERGSYQRRI